MTVLAAGVSRPNRVTTLEEVADWLATAGTAIALDTETTGLEWDAELRLVQLADDKRQYAVTPSAELGDLLHAYKGTIVLHNACFDIHALEAGGVIEPDYMWPRVLDTYVMAHVKDPDRRNGLESLTATLLGVDDKEWKSAFKKRMRKRKWTFATVPLLALSPYGRSDALNTFKLYEYFCRTLSADEWSVVQNEMEALVAVYEVQNHGLRLDLDYARELQDRWQRTIEAKRADFLEKWGIANPNANRQVASALKERGWVPSEHTPTGEPKLDKAVLKELAPAYPLVEDLLALKRIVKWKAAYVDNCLEEVDHRGYVHARYNSLGAKTGRMSCSQPPLQQLPKGGGGEVRRLFIASEGCVIASVDYSAIELRLAGALSGEPRIIEAYANGTDIYQQVADAIGVPRPVAKVVVLASLYGWQGGGAAAPPGYTIPEQKDLIHGFWSTYPTLSRWVQATTRRYRSARSELWGRPLRPHAPYAAANAVIQGTAAEVMKEGLLRLGERGLLPWVAAIVHDEVVLDIHAESAEETVQEVVDTLRDDRFAIPLVAEGEVYGRSWGDGYTE